MSEEVPAMVMDLGSRTVKIGYSGETTPRCILPTVIAKRRLDGKPSKNTYVGQAAVSKRREMALSAPIQNGIVQDWDDMETVLTYLMQEELGHDEDDIKEFPILMTEAPSNSAANREKMAEVMFEKFEVPAWYVALQPVLSLRSTGAMTGLVVDSGFDATTAVPVYQGHPLMRGIKTMDFAGADCTEYLLALLNQQPGVSLSGRDDMAAVQKMKHQYAKIAMDYDKELTSSPSNMYTMPDGSSIKINKEAIMCTEPLFNPSLIEMKCEGLAEIVNNAIQASDRDLRETFYSNIQLSGGNSYLSNFGARLKKELREVAPPATTVVVKDAKFYESSNEQREISAWLGGAELAATEDFEHMWVSKQEYKEMGTHIPHASCF